jgi:hypothetical protein
MTMRKSDKRPSHSPKPHARQKSPMLFSESFRHEAPIRKVNEGVRKTIDNYIEDLIELGKE